MAASVDGSGSDTAILNTNNPESITICSNLKGSPAETVTVKRGRGRPRKFPVQPLVPSALSSTVQLHTTKVLLSKYAPHDLTESPATSLDETCLGDQPVRTPYPATTDNSAKPCGSYPAKREKSSTTGRCESCSAVEVKIFKIGMLKVCKDCEGLMREASGSVRRQNLKSSKSESTKDKYSAVEDANKLAENPIAHYQAPVHVKPGDIPYSTDEFFGTSGRKIRTSSTNEAPLFMLNGDMTIGSSETIAPSSLMFKPHTNDVASVQEIRPKKTGRTPMTNVNVVNVDSTKTAILHVVARGKITASKAVPPQFHSIFPSSMPANRGRKSKALRPGRWAATQLAKDQESPTCTDADLLPISAKSASNDSIKSYQDVLSSFQTTGAFLTRTASRLLCDQTVTGADSNIHGYTFGRPVKVLNVDGTWYFGSMIGLENGKIKIHFDGWGAEWDEWLASDSRRLKTLDLGEVKQREAILQAAGDKSLDVAPPQAGSPAVVTPSRRFTGTALHRTRDSLSSNKNVKDAPRKRSMRECDFPRLEDGGIAGLSSLGTVASVQVEQGAKRMIKNTKADPSDCIQEQPLDTIIPGIILHSQPPAAGLDFNKVQPIDDESPVRHEINSKGTRVRHVLPLAKTQELTSKIHAGKKLQALNCSPQCEHSASANSKTSNLATQGHQEAKEVRLPGYTQGSDKSMLMSVNVAHPKTYPSPALNTHRAMNQIQPWQDQIAQGSVRRASVSVELDGVSCKSRDLSDIPCTPALLNDQDCQNGPKSTAENELKEGGMDNSRGGGESESRFEAEPVDGPGSTTLAFHSLGNPIQLGLEPPEISHFQYVDEEKQILGIVHRVLNTGSIKNRVIEHSHEDYFSTHRTTKKRKASPNSFQGDESHSGHGSKQENGNSDDEIGEDGEVATRTFTKTRDRFAAQLQARQENNGPQRVETDHTIVTKKDPQELQEVRQMAVRNMCNAPLIKYIRQVVYDETERSEVLNITFESRKQKLARILSGRKLTKQRRSGLFLKRISGNATAIDALGITFNEAGHIETSTSSKIAAILKNQRKITQKRKERQISRVMEDPAFSHDENHSIGKGTFQSLRSLTGTKKRKRLLAEDHITRLRQTMVPGTRIHARDRQMDWLIAVIRDVKNSRVLVHYEGYQEFFNEWIDINSERLRFDSSLEQTVPIPTINNQNVLPCVAETVAGGQPNPTLDEDNMKPQESQTISSEARMEALNDSTVPEDSTTQVQCVQCRVKISQFRIYCMYCEAEAKLPGSGREPFNLCLWCFSNAFPGHHDHPRSSFATKVIVGPRGVRPVKGGIITRFEKDMLDMEFKETKKPDIAAMRAAQFYAMMNLESDQGLTYLDQWKDRKVCAFCNDDGNSKDHFIGPYPFLLASTNRYGDTKKKHFWAHDACARHSPEVIQGTDGTWFNVSMAMRRGRTVRCAVCKEKGATIGCFDPKCGRSFHVPCTGKPMSHFEDGVIFWCPQHERTLLQQDTYDETFSCDKCSKILGVNPWQTCVKCSSDYFHTFDLCQECFSQDQVFHEHGKLDFKITSLELMYQEQQERETAQALEQDEPIPAKKKPVTYKPKMRSLSRLVCSYCWSATSAKWRKGYNGVLMCEDCFLAGPVNEVPMQPPISIEEVPETPNSDRPPLPASDLTAGSSSERAAGSYATSAEDYFHSPYLTRTAVSAVRFDHSSSQAVYLDSYGPAENQLFSLPIDTTYYDIPGRAPRWATHSGTDYHGTWLPQTVRRALTKYTNPNDKILSNFLGRGTDAIECFLLGRCCTAVDINPAAITLSIRNCSFAIPPNGAIKAEHRPTILQGDSRKLTGPLFENESFDHVLSHPPYKDCVAYSTHIDGDLSRFGNALEFQQEMNSVVRESYRLLKMGRRCTLGIGDNREHCFYIPVSFQLIRQYINEGFELEELIVKRQRYCAMFGLGTYLCVQFDFLCFTHEFIATLRKVPKEQIDTMILEPDFTLLDNVCISSTTRAIPSCPIERKSVVMGSVWTFKPTEEHDFPTLCVSRMVERFGRNEANWTEFKIEFKTGNLDHTQADQWTEHIVETLPPEEEEMVSYERDRLQQIQENNRMLLALGLITDLSESSDDIGHQIKISKDTPCFPPPAQIALRMVAHIPGSVLKSHQVSAYRTALMQISIEALEKLPVTGMLVIGAQDIRTESGKLIPLGMLILEDIIRVVGDDCLKLKELVEAVPDGYQKDRRKVTCVEEFPEEICTPNDEVPTKHLPIVHACYLVFTKVKEKQQ
ncbi:hypothetical protein EDD21DRAFT_369349 [Dissophora ornata]|nr:hypothetical protein EDD21DRAFT_369349 [Dissophora ornata]